MNDHSYRLIDRLLFINSTVVQLLRCTGNLLIDNYFTIDDKMNAGTRNLLLLSSSRLHGHGYLEHARTQLEELFRA